MSPTRPVLRTPLGLTSLALLLVGVALETLVGGGPDWYTVGGEVVLRIDYEDLGLSRADGSLPAIADAFVQVWPGAMAFVALGIAWTSWARRVWARVLAGWLLVGLATAVGAEARTEALRVSADPRGADAAVVVVGTGLVTAAALVGLTTMMLGLPQWIRCAAGSLVVLAFTVGQAIGIVQVLGAATVDVSPTLVPVASLVSMLALALSPAVLAVAVRRRDQDGEWTMAPST